MTKLSVIDSCPTQKSVLKVFSKSDSPWTEYKRIQDSLIVIQTPPETYNKTKTHSCYGFQNYFQKKKKILVIRTLHAYKYDLNVHTYKKIPCLLKTSMKLLLGKKMEK